jgi:hypothetical protein
MQDMYKTRARPGAELAVTRDRRTRWKGPLTLPPYLALVILAE